MNMSSYLLYQGLFAFCVYHAVCAALDIEETKSDCGVDTVLRCTAPFKTGVQYRAVRWYKVGEHPSPSLNGLLARNLPNGTTLWYVGLQRDVQLVGDSRDILLPNVTSKDSGLYQCTLSAPVGEQNQDGQVRLTVTGCPEPEYLMEDVFTVVFASVLLMVALLIFFMSYACLRNMLKEKTKTTKKEKFLNGQAKLLEKKDMLIYTLGPNWSTARTKDMKHMYV
ncbi:CD83 antigen [Polymixia lowei]